MSTELSNERIDRFIGSAARDALLRFRLTCILAFQAVMVSLSYALAFFIRFDFIIPPEYLQTLLQTLPFVFVCRMGTYYAFGIHTGSWRFVSMQDLVDTAKAVTLGSVLFLVLLVFVHGLQGYPRSIFLLDTLLNFVVLGGSRFLIRYGHEYQRATPKSLKYVLIAGAGKAGALVLNEIRTNPGLGMHAVGFVDDDPHKKGVTIQGVPVLGRIEEIPELAQRRHADEVIIAIPSAGYKDIVRMAEIARSADIPVKELPGLGQIICRQEHASRFRDVSCEELLGRRSIKFSRESDLQLLKDEIAGRSVCVTGAGGSIGSELCRQVAIYRPRVLILYERSESALFELELDLRREYPEQRILPVIGDILDDRKFRHTLAAHQVDLIYHAAAYKHVPMMEREPLEAIRNNILGTMNVAQLAVEEGVQKFVLISTDKAVNPANVMGTTKRVAELIAQSMGGRGTRFISVRFGNVIGSNGSVIPVFKRQIAEGGPVTVTHPDITRYFMSIPEAVQLVMTAGAMGTGEEIFLLDMGEPVKITDLANDLIRLSGLVPDRDINVVFTGLRPGEKLHEELYWQGEGIITTENKKITMLRPNGSHGKTILDNIQVVRGHVDSGEVDKAVRTLAAMVPEAVINGTKVSIAPEALKQEGEQRS